MLLGIFSVASDNSMCPGSTQPLKMSTSILLGIKKAGAYGQISLVFMSCFINLSHLLEVYYWLHHSTVRAGRLRCVARGMKAQAYWGQRSRILLSFCFVHCHKISVYWTYLLTNLCEIQNLRFLETFTSKWNQRVWHWSHTHTHTPHTYTHI
jgi:hypothetical protein